MSKNLKYNEGLVQAILAQYVSISLKMRHFFCNLYSLYDNTFELDFLYFDRYKFLNECEVKVSKQDALVSEFNKTEKHRRLSIGDESCPNKFWVVCPPDVVPTADLLPDYCGLKHVLRDKYGVHKIKVIRKAPLIHDKISYVPSDFFQKVYYQLSKYQSKWFSGKVADFDSRLKDSKLVVDKPKRKRKKRTYRKLGDKSISAGLPKRRKKK
tara:strand:+ start:6188 stop:6820 length:633 start_codon:yes stop_codon:yes gene_type:complete